MKGTIPVMRVNYTILQLIGSFFISERSERYREQLKERINIFFSSEHVLLASSARCAIYMIIKSLPQHKVIVPSYTCEVVVEAVRLAGKEAVFAPVNKETLNISEYPDIDSDTIVIATHQYGFPCEINNLSKTCKEKGAILIEDCAGSIGSRIDGKLTGTFGDYAVFSFSASKTLHSPTKGGFVIARNKELFEKIQPLANILKDDSSFKIKQIAKAIGFCIAKNRVFSTWLFKKGRSSSNHSNTAYLSDTSYRRTLKEWQAYIVLKQFENVESLLMERRKIYRRYHNGINNPLVLHVDMDMGGVYIRFAVLTKDRARFIEHCRHNHVAVGTGYNRLYCSEDQVTAHEISKEIVYLPFGNGYSSREIEKVIFVVNSFK